MRLWTAKKERKEPEQRHVFDDFEMELEIERENDFLESKLEDTLNDRDEKIKRHV